MIRLGGAFRIGVIGPSMLRHRPGLRSAEYGLVWVVRGRGELLGAGETPVLLRPGSLFQRLPGQPLGHRYAAAPPPLTCFLALPAGILAALQACGLPTLRSTCLVLRDQRGLLGRWIALADRLQAAPAGEEAGVLAEALAFAVELHRRAAPVERDDTDARWLAQASAALARHACDRIGTRAVLAQLGGSYAWARRRFTVLAGTSPAAFRIARRMEAACALLLGGELSISDLAGRLGYATPFAFTRQFTHLHGQSPSRFRESMAE